MNKKLEYTIENYKINEYENTIVMNKLKKRRRNTSLMAVSSIVMSMTTISLSLSSMIENIQAFGLISISMIAIIMATSKLTNISEDEDSMLKKIDTITRLKDIMSQYKEGTLKKEGKKITVEKYELVREGFNSRSCGVKIKMEDFKGVNEDVWKSIKIEYTIEPKLTEREMIVQIKLSKEEKSEEVKARVKEINTTISHSRIREINKIIKKRNIKEINKNVKKSNG